MDNLLIIIRCVRPARKTCTAVIHLLDFQQRRGVAQPGLERCVRDAEAASSNLATPTISFPQVLWFSRNLTYC